MRASLFDEGEVQPGTIVCGIDEAGRGPLAGPVVAAAVILPEGFLHPDIRDSKTLKSPMIRELAGLIKNAAVSYGIGCRDAAFIDETDILTATFRAMEAAVAMLSVKPHLILIDGNQKNPYLRHIRQIALVKGESRSLAIAAASILAKEHRDRLMEEYALQYRGYGFEKHKGYGTKAHLDMLRRLGPCPIHRRTFDGVLTEEEEQAPWRLL